MSDWNEQAAPNNNLNSGIIKTSKLVHNQKGKDHEFSEELSDGGERNKIIEGQKKKNQ